MRTTLFLEVREKLISNLKLLQDALFTFDGKGRLKIEISTYQRRSLKANGYYWSEIVGNAQKGILEMWGEKVDLDTAHEFLKQHCNYKEVVSPDGVVTKLTMSTKDLTKAKFEIYAEECRRFIKEWFGIECYLPNEQKEIEYLNQQEHDTNN